MNKTIYLSKKHKLRFTTCTHNHIWVYLTLPMIDITGNIIYTADGVELRKNFIFDTGAENTILSKKRSNDLGYKNCEIKERTRAAIGGNIIWCSKIGIPDIVITNDIVIHKPIVLVPDDYACNINILGQDILQSFNYYMDNRLHNIYFDKEK